MSDAKLSNTVNKLCKQIEKVSKTSGKGTKGATGATGAAGAAGPAGPTGATGGSGVITMFITSDTVVPVPPNSQYMEATLWGGGGAGGGVNAGELGGGGGSSNAIINFPLNVLGGGTVVVVIGAGGTPNVLSGDTTVDYSGLILRSKGGGYGNSCSSGGNVVGGDGAGSDTIYPNNDGNPVNSGTVSSGVPAPVGYPFSISGSSGGGISSGDASRGGNFLNYIGGVAGVLGVSGSGGGAGYNGNGGNGSLTNSIGQSAAANSGAGGGGAASNDGNTYFGGRGGSGGAILTFYLV